ncbi:sulfite exporter TauE/SafE family protein [Brumimicrobium aurantiacum]|uniref:Sulfite exporter TauE/SafE family protein n=1 Tax=Brumimicrobium aurantiacum TaxID=1737063 RepID=A0A3E1EUZ7_9FLAO|nr:sulfite exporter TauE/SafE family protein [Brumimicrobium aurantiacum]RFC53377.1 sulfite exporter TauE/SafE family protein [Brumimicrobium aurantiacum]
MFWAAITLGLLANLHCIGMCGPIALALPIGNLSKIQKVFSVLTYNFGRIVVYAFLGAGFGLFGYGLKLIGILQILSIILGVFLIFQALIQFNIIKFTKPNITGKALNFLKKGFNNQFKKRSIDAFFMMGVFNGLLPCGMVYTALIASLLLGSWLEGFSFMFFYGIGTLPVMISLPFIGNFFGQQLRAYYQKVLPYTLLILGIIFVLRGANLGIPYLSPAIDTNAKPYPAQTINCY